MRSVLLLATLVLLAGCVRPEDLPTEGNEPLAQTGNDAAAHPASDVGRLVVRARMPDLSPLGGVALTVADRTATTDGNGTATFDAVPVGKHTLEARKEAHRTALLDVTIGPNATTDVEVVLAPEAGDQHAHEKGIFAHRDLYTFHGHFDCSATYVIITGDCLVVVDNATATAGQTARPGDATNERYLIDFPLDAGWRTLVVEMKWTANASTPATGEGMTLSLEPAEAPADGHAARYARAVGGAPLALRLENGGKHPTATAEDMPNPAGGEVIRARAYVMGAAHNAGGLGTLGVGATLKHDFTLHVSIFYEAPAPEGYTALGDG